MNNKRREELNRIAAAMKSLSDDLAAVIADEDCSNSRMVFNTPYEIRSYYALNILDHAITSASNTIEAITLATKF